MSCNKLGSSLTLASSIFPPEKQFPEGNFNDTIKGDFVPLRFVFSNITRGAPSTCFLVPVGTLNPWLYPSYYGHLLSWFMIVSSPVLVRTSTIRLCRRSTMALLEGGFLLPWYIADPPKSSSIPSTLSQISLMPFYLFLDWSFSLVFACERFGEHGDVISACFFCRHVQQQIWHHL